ncbi:glycosyltransferase family 2 protein [Candidatus Magnetaquicoccus inordinatus]|uniref:glycosyltransferase family 2 protein n=1 Tax=Candidatus Magnetaquicoccus inordinatus TaxID=2496818 RepID=UPI00187D2432|nr:glycosyltransferase family 2 protein [Candidatus Magnetaquicoccus inordinatus]
MNDSPWVRVIIVNYHAEPWLQQSVAALLRQSDSHFEVVIVDNESDPQQETACFLPDERFQWLAVSENLGFAAAANLGARGAKVEWLAMLNPDTVPTDGWLAAMRAAIVRFPDTALFGSTQRMAADPRLWDGAGDYYSIYGLAWRAGYGQLVSALADGYRPFSPCAAAAFYRRDLFERVGGFAESFFCYLEDVDLGFRLNLLGFQARQAVQAEVIHVGSAISGQHSPFTLFHSVRNGLWMQLRCMPWPLLWLSLPLYVLAQGWLSFRTRGARQRWHALWQGVRGWRMIWQQRHSIQMQRCLSTMQLARLLVWRPSVVMKRQRVVLPLVAACGPEQGR